MLFNSIEYLFFLPLVFLLYWLFSKRSAQNIFVIAASYFFYACWDWHFLSLIIITTLSSWAAGCVMERYEAQKCKRLTVLAASIMLNMAILIVFKYYNFFAQSFTLLLGSLGLSADYPTLNFILPVGISFYTFQAVGYTIDVYKRDMPPCHSLIEFAAFICFFPQLVAGPIEPASHLLPQFQRFRRFNYGQALMGTRMILWGLFKKMVVADSCAITVDMVWNDYTHFSSVMLFVASLLFSIQIYCDFSGYSDIAIGSAKLFGIELLDNFKLPYFSTSIPEFWRRWHISLMKWFRTYIYFPLGGSRQGRWTTLRNVFAVFAVSGLWHGANYTFIVWGLYHALLFIPYILWNFHSKQKIDTAFISLKQLPAMTITFLFVSFGWIIFRAPDLQSAIGYVSSMMSVNITLVDFSGITAIAVSLLCMAIEWGQRHRAYVLDFSDYRLLSSPWTRAVVYYAIVMLILSISASRESFIYFQF